MRTFAKEETELFHMDGDTEKTTQQPKNIFKTILGSELPVEEKRLERLEQESFELLMASGQTLSRNLALSTFHLLANPDKLRRLRCEVQEQMDASESGRMTLSAIESLPYLVCRPGCEWSGSADTKQTAVIKETLRVSAIVFSRLPMTAPTMDMKYGTYVIPAGVGR